MQIALEPELFFIVQAVVHSHMRSSLKFQIHTKESEAANDGTSWIPYLGSDDPEILDTLHDAGTVQRRNTYI